MLNKEKIQEKREQLNEQQLERARRYHRVFVQNEDGAAILQELLNTYVFGGFTPPDSGPGELGKAEARREMVCMITQQTTLAEQ